MTPTDSRRRARTPLLLLLAGLLLLTAPLPADDLTLADGSIIADVQDITPYPDHIVVRSSSGVQRIDMERLKPAQQAQYDYDPEAAADYRRQRQLQAQRDSQARRQWILERRLYDQLQRESVRVNGHVLAYGPDGDRVIEGAVSRPGGPNASSTIAVSDTYAWADLDATLYRLGTIDVLDVETRDTRRLSWWTTSRDEALRRLAANNGEPLHGVSIVTYHDRDQPRAAPPAFASGFLVDGGVILTTADYLAGRDSVWIRQQGDPVQTRVLHTDRHAGIALLAIPADWQDRPRLQLGVRQPQSQQVLYSLGYPGGAFAPDDGRFGRGEVLVPPDLARDRRSFYLGHFIDVGSAGSALVDSRGQVLGMLTGQTNAAAPYQRPFARALAVRDLRQTLQSQGYPPGIPTATPPPADPAALAVLLQRSTVQICTEAAWPTWR